jgi:putative oxygen-independent coproporphyrinogen III oxidase
MAANPFVPESIPLGLYIHIPWCVKKCPYCDFNSHTLKSPSIPADDYIAALEDNMVQYRPLISNRAISTIFFGGGTPSLLSGKQIDKILQLVRHHYPVEDMVEITLEANPGTVEQQKFVDFYHAGINRISLGVQSFQDRYLDTLGRIHHGDEAKRAIDAAQQAGFHNINIDLMYALPGQSTEDALLDVATAMTFGTPHLSWYQLTIEPNTAFFHKPPIVPTDTHIVDMEIAGHAYLAEQGFASYEISAWSRHPDARCRHNYQIWQYGDYVGIGAGACGKITQKNGIIRTTQTKHPQNFMRKLHAVNDTVVEPSARLFEYMLNHLRLKEPLYYLDYQARTGGSIAAVKTALATLPPEYIEQQPEGFTLTQQGHRFYNDVVAAFL